jgi:glycosyltransferase involved in cell wall biosynthesis
LESDYTKQLVEACLPFKPDIVLSANTPSLPQYKLAQACRRHGIRLVSWVQDVYGLAAYRLLGRKLPGVGHLVGQYFLALDRSAARASDAIVVITEDFSDLFAGWGIERSRIHAIHNWAPLDALPVRPRENDWSRAQGLGDKLRFVYSGTLAMKHNPALLLELARMLDRDALGELVVVSEGAGVAWLAEQAAAAGIGAIRVLGFQPFDMLPDVLGSGDVLVAILEADAGVFSVPSKVLSYLCAGRAVLLAVPTENLAARIVVDCGAGLVVGPTDLPGFAAAAARLATDAALRDRSAQAARQYAETHFNIGHITDRFEAILAGRSS